MSAISSTTIPGYRSPLNGWHEDAWVRTGAPQDHPFEPGLDFYSRDLVPLLRVPEAQALSEEQIQEILVLHLYNYLEFTVRLEMGPVNEVCTMIREASFLAWLPTQMKDDAIRIYTDEGGHAEMSNALQRRVQAYTSICPELTKPQFLVALDELTAERPPAQEDFIRLLFVPAHADFVRLLFVIVSETLITGTLTKLPIDARVQPAVKQVAGDHARDERRHHAYFSQLLTMMWPRLPRPVRQEAIHVFPRLIHAFVDIDQRATRRMTERYPQIFPDPEIALKDLAAPGPDNPEFQQAVRPTLSLFKRAGILDEPGAPSAFERSGFVVG
jgi:hypothetical protein